MQLSETEVRIVHGEQSIEYERRSSKYRVVHWTGAPRRLERSVGRESAPGDPPQYDPSWLASIGDVSARTLDAYAAAAEEVA